MTALDTDSTAQRVVTQPKGFDIADIEYFTLKKVWGAGNLQPMDISRLQQFDKIVAIFKDGKLTPTSKIAQGTAPHTVSFVEKPGDKKFATGMTNRYTMVPTIYNADTLGIRPDLIVRPIGSWTGSVCSDSRCRSTSSPAPCSRPACTTPCRSRSSG